MPRAAFPGRAVPLVPLAGLAASLLARSPALAEPPRVVALTPEAGEVAVDPACPALRVEFDQDMRPGRSLCQMGGEFPRLLGEGIRWESPRVLVVPVQLQPDREYTLAVNCPAAQNFRSLAGEPAPTTMWTFRTAGSSDTASAPARLTSDQNARAIAALRRALEDRYAHRDRLVADWDGLFRTHEPALFSSTSPASFARAASRMLAPAKDVHLTLRVGPAVIATAPPGKGLNADPRQLASLVPARTQGDAGVWSGRFDDSVGYLWIPEWSSRTLAAALPLLDALRDAPGLVIDVRGNGGGDELAARAFAGRFVGTPAVYSRHRTRDPDRPEGWSATDDRVVEPVAPRFAGRVAVLIGPACASSNESFILMMRCGAGATLIGDTTRGASGNPRPVDLGNGVTILVPTWVDMLPDGTPLEGRGIDPDLGVSPVVGAKQDAVLEAGRRAARGDAR